MLTKERFKKSIVDGIKAGRLDPCNGAEFGEIYTDLPQYYWTMEDGQVVEESPFYVDDEVKQAMLDIIDEYGVDDWYDQYQQEA